VVLSLGEGNAATRSHQRNCWITYCKAARDVGAAVGGHASGHAHQCQKGWHGYRACRRVSQRAGPGRLTEGKDVVVEYHWLDGRYEELAPILNDAISRHVAVIATPANTPGSLAAKAATSTIPVVFGVSEEFATEVDAKRLGLMHELLPKAKRLAVLVNPANAKTADATAEALREAAPVWAWNCSSLKRPPLPKSMMHLRRSPMRRWMACL
jgi:hypothetical protein